MNVLRPTFFSLSPFSSPLDDAFHSLAVPARASGHQRPFPPLNAWEDEQAVTLEAELPGFKMEDIEITMTGRELTLKGRREVEHPEGSQPLVRERTGGEFTRTIRVSVPIDTAKVSATLQNGILTITLPKSEAARSRKININASNN